jgi:glycosyltransferase involved in cell wall biosynthesis
MSRVYLMVLPVPCYRLEGDRFATESAFVGHLRLLLRSLSPSIERIVVAAPWVDQDSYERVRGGWSVLSGAEDRISYIPLHPASQGRLRYWLGLPWQLRRLAAAVGAAGYVHAGPSLLWKPCEFPALVLGWLARRRTIYVVDIDQRESPRMLRAAGRISRADFVRATYLHNVWGSVQTHLARYMVTVGFLKGRALVRDYGRGKPSFHYILDAAHDATMVLSDAERSRREEALLGREPGTLRAVYFGRLVAYKGIDLMLHAVQLARRSGVQATLDIYGAGEQEDQLRRLAHAEELRGHVRFHGARPYGAEFLREIGEHDVLLACPLSEDTPRSAVDAQARGMPVLALDSYYYRELEADGGGVSCVPWPDVEALAARMASLSRDRRALAALAAKGVAFAAANTQEAWLERRARWTLG